MKNSGLAAIQGGSGLAHEEAGTFNIDVDWPDAFASKPAPTGGVSASGIYGWPKSQGIAVG
jgi:hypothetical protein